MSCVRISIFATNNVPPIYRDGDVLVFDTTPDFDIKLSRYVEEMTNLNKIKVDGVLGFDLPSTPKNDTVLKKYVDPHNSTTKKTPLTVQVWANSMHYLRFHDMYVVRYKNNTYSCELRAGSEHWIAALSTMNLTDIKYTNEEKIKYDEATVTEYNLKDAYEDGEFGIRFPMINFGKFTFKEQGLQLPDFRPMLSVLWILQRGFCKAGWKFRSSVLETDWGRRLITYVLDKNFGSDYSKLKLLRANLMRDSTQNTPIAQGGNGQTVSFDKVIQNDGEFWDQSYVYAQPGFYKGAGIFDINLKLFVKATKKVVTIGSERKMDIRVEMRLRTPYGLDILINQAEYTFSFSFAANVYRFTSLEINMQDVQIDAGNELYFRFYWSTSMEPNNYEIQILDQFEHREVKYATQLTINPTKGFLQRGDEYLIESFVRKDKFLDFLKGVTHLVNGKFHTDFQKNEVWLYPSYNVKLWEDEFAEGYFTNDVNVDLTDISVCDSEDIENPDSLLKRYFKLKFKGDGDAAIKKFIGEEKGKEYLSYNHLNGEQYENETEIYENPYFEPTYNGIVDGLDVTTGAPVDMPFMMDNVDIENPKATFEVQPRILYWASLLSQRHVTSLTGWPDDMTYSQIRIFDEQIVYNLPTAWQDSEDQEYSRLAGGSDLSPTYPEKATRDQNVSYGIKLNNKDLYHFFYQQYFAEMKNGSSIEMLMLLTAPNFLNFSFRNCYTFKALGRTVVGRLISIKDFNYCGVVSTPCLFMPTIVAVDSCAIIPEEGVPEKFCRGNAPTLIITKSGNCYNFSMGGSNVSPISSVTYEYRYVSTNTWINAASICDPEDGFEARMIVDYGDDCPTISRYRFVDACGNSPEINATYNYNDNCFTAEVIGLFTSTSHTTVIEYSADNGDTWLPYVEGECVEVPEGVTLIKIRATVTYPDGCPDDELEIDIDVPPGEVNCDDIDADVECTQDGMFVRIGNVVGPEALDIIQYRHPPDLHWRVFDEVNSIHPCPFEYRRVIFYCNDVCPVYCGPIHLCECNCNETFTVDCIDHKLIVSGELLSCTIAWSGPGGFTATGNNVPISVSGVYTGTITCGACTYTVTYTFDHNDAGTGDDEIL